MKYKVTISEIEEKTAEGDRYPASREIYDQTVNFLDIRALVAVVNSLPKPDPPPSIKLFADNSCG